MTGGEISSLLSARFETAAGSLETLALKNANAAVYSITEYPDKELENHESAHILLIHRMRQVQHFLNCLWFLKDNSANFELGFQEYPFRSPYGSTVTSNFLAVFASKADGSRDFTEFNASEVRAARDISVKLFGPLQLNQHQKEFHGYIVPEDFNRVSRVLHILQSTRASADLGLKVAHYMTCFEALFSTDSAELAHKLAERMALFLGKDVAHRTKIFKQVKATYNIRSKVVHGDKITKRMAQQIHELLGVCDELLRESLTKIVTTPKLYEVFQRPPNELEEYFLGMVFEQESVGD